MQTKLDIKDDIQKKAIAMLQQDNVRFEAMVGFARLNGIIEPFVMMGNDIPNKDNFYHELYDLFDKYFDLKTIRDQSMKK